MKKVFYLNRYIYILLISFLISLGANLFVLPIKVQSYNSDLVHFILSSAAELSLVFVITIIFFVIFSFNKFVLKTLSVVFFGISSWVAYIALHNKIIVNVLLLGALLETDSNEVKAQMNIGFISWIVFCIVLPMLIFIFVIRIKKFKEESVVRNIKSFVVLVVTLVSFMIASFVFGSKMYEVERGVRSSLVAYIPINFVTAAWQSYKLIRYNLNMKREDISKSHKFIWDNNIFKDKPVNVVLIIGESARSDRQSLNGYKRDTNSFLKNTTNLTSYKNVLSCGTISRWSVNCILSHRNRVDFSFPIKETNIVSVFNSLGFKTYFLSSQTMFEHGPINYFYIASQDASVVAFNNELRVRSKLGDDITDEALDPYIKDTIADKSKHKFIVYYFIGSHVPYPVRYPKKFDYYHTKDATDDQNLGDKYDNTIRHTSYIISSMIKKYKNTNTMIYYVSDHGESLGENGMYAHGAPYDTSPIEQRHVVQFVWVSDGMKALLGQGYKNLVSHKDENLSQDNAFSTLLGCIGVKGDLVQSKLNLCGYHNHSK